MERGSDKHSPRIDESISSEMGTLAAGGGGESRAQESRLQEDGAGAGVEAVADAVVAGGDRPTGSEDVPGHDELERRAEIARHLRPSVFPARPLQLVETARAEHAPDWIVEALAGLPEGVYEHFEAVWEAVGGREELRGA